jgi:hypothetical protein
MALLDLRANGSELVGIGQYLARPSECRCSRDSGSKEGSPVRAL